MSTGIESAAKRPIRSTIPARLDRLSWSPFHTRMVCGLGAAVDTGRHLGNFPQAFSDLALVEAAERIVLSDLLAEINS